MAAFIAARVEHMEDLQRLNMAHAWHVAALSRTKRLPKLETLLQPAKKKRRGKMRIKSWQEIMEVCRSNNAALGGIELPAGSEVPPAGGATD